jgi:hypothetical protein
MATVLSTLFVDEYANSYAGAASLEGLPPGLLRVNTERRLVYRSNESKKEKCLIYGKKLLLEYDFFLNVPSFFLNCNNK